ncbi:glycine zipper family protein [Cyanobium sp. NIES-981]|uniref:glycine zipper family protein n=1 Tax=Cyanobium sp. NIES-981 TaxID=1851505 RepID=UPI0007DCE9DF|nr:glycine zipper family protein [Cyanobium sp. NIES-981]SBO44122.1 conserved protein of unknown function [Cyanobium sp. NIES-981]
MIPLQIARAGARSSALIGAALLGALVTFGPTTVANAQDLFIYPAAGQSPEQQRQDGLECRLWAIDQTGFDPTQPAPASSGALASPPQVQRQGPGTARSTVRGAVAGTAVGAIVGNTGRGAAAGATQGLLSGTARGVDQRRAQQQANDDWARQQQIAEAERQQLLQYRRRAFNRAVTACMEGRGYTVS